MKYRTAEKCSLFKGNIKNKNERKVERIEIQLLSLEDDLSMMDELTGKIVSIHLPLPPFCNIGNILEILKNKESEKIEYLKKVIEKARKYDCGIVIHADTTLERYYQKDKEGLLIEFLKDSGVVWHIENVTDEIRNENDCITAPVQISNYINSKVKKNICFPLLDICHFQMIQSNFDTLLKFNLKTVLKMYESEKYYIHFTDKVGCGDDNFGGKHGFNFKYNIPLMHKILNEIKNTNPMLVLEIKEADYTNPLNVIELEGFIKEYENA